MCRIEVGYAYNNNTNCGFCYCHGNNTCNSRHYHSFNISSKEKEHVTTKKSTGSKKTKTHRHAVQGVVYYRRYSSGSTLGGGGTGTSHSYSFQPPAKTIPNICSLVCHHHQEGILGRVSLLRFLQI